MSAASRTSYLSSLQAYRGLAATAVVFDHLHFHSALNQGAGLVPDVCRLGHLGVDFFFVLSGFIIQHIHGDDAGHPERGGDYAWRRVARIWPLLAALTTLKLAYMLVSGAGVRAEKFELATIVTSYLCLPLPGWPTTGWPVLDVAWTLRHEALFYALFLVPIALGRRAWRVLVATWIALIAFVLARGEHPVFPIDFLASPLNAEFLLGVATAIAVARWRPRATVALAELVVGVALAVVGAWCYARAETDYGKANRLVLALGLACVIHASVALEAAGKQRAPRLLSVLGDASYSLYLWHGFVVAGLLGLWPRLPSALREFPRAWLCLTAFAAIASSVLVHRCVERPLTDAFRRLRPRDAAAGTRADRPSS